MRRAARWANRHRLLTAAIVVTFGLTPVWWSLGSALRNPALGTSFGARAAEWARDHGGRPIVVWAENTWYTHHAPAVGGSLPVGAIPTVTDTPSPAPAPSAEPIRGSGQQPAPTPNAIAHLPAPARLQPFVAHPVTGEGVWQPVGRRVDGVPAVYETFLRPDAIHTGLVAGVAWMDTTLLRARLYSGSYIPGGGPWENTAPVQPADALSLVAAFNSGFRMQDAEGGYYSEGRTVRPLVAGAASLAILRDGTATVGQWGRDISASSDVVAVRQNLRLLVDNGQPVPGLMSNDHAAWGRTVSNRVYVWRSGIGVTSTGALVYVAGPGLNITSLAGLLVRAGAVRGMELDINTDWVNYSVWTPTSASSAANPSNGRDLLSSMVGKPSRYFDPKWARDFITMSARAGGGG
jgi:hypothetical protein